MPVARLAVLITHPVQYTKPVFQALHARADLELLVVFGCDHGLRASLDPDFGVPFAWDSAPSDGFPHRFASHAPLAALSSWPSALPIALRAVAMIRAFRPDAVLVFAYSPAFISLATVLLRASGQRLLLRAEATDRALDHSRSRQWSKDLVLRLWYRMFHHVFPIGSDSSDHFARLGVPPQRRTPVRYAVDVEFFRHQVEQWLPQRAQLRQSVAIPADALVLLWSGKITAVKINDRWAADLIDYTAKPSMVEGSESPYQYILIGQDIFSRKIFVHALRSKTADVVEQAFQSIVRRGGHPDTPTTD
jgi:hypothetical protein